MKPDQDLLAAVRGGLNALGDAVKAPQMQTYMKSAMPYRGVATPARTRLMKDVLASRAPRDRQTWEATARALWDGAGYREDRYAAIDLCGHRSARAWQDPATLPLYEHMIVDGAWWDHVDAVAIHLVGPILRAHHTEVVPTIRRWATAEDRWRRRSSVIVQNGAKHSTDTGLLAFAIEANVDHPDFFIRKGIGWALREYAKDEPGVGAGVRRRSRSLPTVPTRGDEASDLTVTRAERIGSHEPGQNDQRVAPPGSFVATA